MEYAKKAESKFGKYIFCYFVGNGENEEEKTRYYGDASGKYIVKQDMPELRENAGRGSYDSLAEDIAEGKIDIKISIGTEGQTEEERGCRGYYEIQR